MNNGRRFQREPGFAPGRSPRAARRPCRLGWFALLTVAFVCVPTPNSALAQPQTVKVSVATAQMIDAPDTVTLVGNVDAARVSRIASEIGGIVQEMPVRQGDRVEQGDTLCRLDAGALQWALSEARARSEALKAVHDELVAGTRMEDIAMLQAALDEAKANLERWKFEVERVEGLESGRASNPKELSDARAEFAIAREKLAAAQAAYDRGVAGPRSYEIARAAHDWQAQQSLVKRLERDLEQSVIRAPFSGAIVERFVELGEWVGVGDQIVELVELDTMLVRVDAPESAFPYLTRGAVTRIIIDALDRSFEGRIKHVIPRAVENARTIPVEIEIDNEQGRLADGMFARAIVRAGPSRSVVAVPKDAVVERGATFYIATIQRGQQGELTGMLRPVTVGIGTDKWIEITSANVEPGTPVAVRGTERLAPFPMPVQIVDELGRPAELPAEATHHGDPADHKDESKAREGA